MVLLDSELGLFPDQLIRLALHFYFVIVNASHLQLVILDFTELEFDLHAHVDDCPSNDLLCPHPVLNVHGQIGCATDY